ncbi:MAG: hypothetical protein ACYDEV_07740 [Acidiferrobacter sp.]
MLISDMSAMNEPFTKYPQPRELHWQDPLLGRPPLTETPGGLPNETDSGTAALGALPSAVRSPVCGKVRRSVGMLRARGAALKRSFSAPTVIHRCFARLLHET